MKRKPAGAKKITGFSILEIMVTVAVVGILGKIVLDAGTFQLQRESINNVSNQFAGWLEEISNVPTRNNSGTTVVCEINLNTGDIIQGAALASVTGKNSTGTTLSPNPCSTQPTFNVPRLFGRTLSVASRGSLTTWTYTPRGSINSTSDIELRLALKGLTPLRCITIGNTLGLIELGRIDNTSNVASTTSCSYDFRQ